MYHRNVPDYFHLSGNIASNVNKTKPLKHLYQYINANIRFNQKKSDKNFWSTEESLSIKNNGSTWGQNLKEGEREKEFILQLPMAINTITYQEY